jgi:chemotaxis family two-component system sensor kinase Cph1
MRENRASELGVEAPADAVAIQPHAMLLVLDRDGARVAGASANAAAWLGRDPAEDLSGLPLEALVDPDSLARLRAALGCGTLERPVSVASVARADGARLGIGFVHRAAGHALLEVESPVADESQEAVPAAWLDSLMADGPRIGTGEEIDIVGELATAAAQLREATGFDRVSIHRFTPDANLELLAESCAPGAPSLAGLVFGPDEVPAWSQMLGVHWVRAIADVDAQPVPVRLPPALAAEPTPLLNVFARRAIASHEAYLRRLGVRSTVVLVLSNAGVVWGKVACHAFGEPRRISAPQRIALAGLARGLSHRIAAHEAAPGGSSGSASGSPRPSPRSAAATPSRPCCPSTPTRSWKASAPRAWRSASARRSNATGARRPIR